MLDVYHREVICVMHFARTICASYCLHHVVVLMEMQQVGDVSSTFGCFTMFSYCF